MWKHYIKFHNTILKQEKIQLYYVSNIHKIPYIKKTLITSQLSFPDKIRNLFLILCGLQLIFKKKGFILTTKKASLILKGSQRSQPVGSKITLNKKRSFLFLQFLVFNLFPQLDIIHFFDFKDKEQNYTFKLDSLQIIKQLTPFFHGSFKIQISLLCGEKKERNVLFWRLFKIPVK